MMRWGLIVCCGAVLIAGRSDPKKASKANFAAAIDSYLAKHPLCIVPITGDIQALASGPGIGTFPAYFELHGGPNGQVLLDNETRSMQALAKAGVLTARSTTIAAKALFGPPNQKTPVREYDLTDAGRKALVKALPGHVGGDKLCFGTAEVTEVTRFTEPSAAMGMTLSEVNYNST